MVVRSATAVLHDMGGCRKPWSFQYCAVTHVLFPASISSQGLTELAGVRSSYLLVCFRRDVAAVLPVVLENYHAKYMKTIAEQYFSIFCRQQGMLMLQTFPSHVPILGSLISVGDIPTRKSAHIDHFFHLISSSFCSLPDGKQRF